MQVLPRFALVLTCDVCPARFDEVSRQMDVQAVAIESSNSSIYAFVDPTDYPEVARGIYRVRVVVFTASLLSLGFIVGLFGSFQSISDAGVLEVALRLISTQF